MSTDRLRVGVNQRIDIDDFRFVAGEGSQGSLRQVTKDFMLEEGLPRPQDRTGYILSGFAISNPSASQLRVTKGKAILSQRLDGAVVRGVVTTEGDTTITIDLNSYAAGDYGIYIRFEEIEAEEQGRIFWNPTGDGEEYTDSVPTRYVARWSLRVESTSPGTEWLKIGEVAQATMTITDQRPFYFEGTVDSTYASGWSSDGDGDADDRHSNRSYGISDLHTFIRATKQCIEDIKGRGLKRWWDRDIGGMNIGFDANPVTKRLAVGDADFYLDQSSSPKINFATDDYFQYVRGFNTLGLTINGSTNHVWSEDRYTVQDLVITNIMSVSDTAGEGVDSSLVPTSTGVNDLGKPSYRWKEVHVAHGFFDKIIVDDAATNGVLGNLVPAAINTYDLGSNIYDWKDLYINGIGNIGKLNMTALIGGNVISDLLPDSSENLGNTTYRWGTLWVSGTATIDTAALDFLEVSDSADEGVGTHLVPKTTKTYDLGNASYLWRQARIQLLNVSSATGGNDGCTDLHPTADSLFELGEGIPPTTLRAWKNIFVDKVYETDAEYLWAKGTADSTISQGSWSSILADTHILASGLSVTSTAGQIKCTAGHEGWYKCDAIFIIDPQSYDAVLSLQVSRNGSKITSTLQNFNIKTANGQVQACFTFFANLQATTDYVEVEATHDNTGNVLLVGSDSSLTVVRAKKARV